MFVNQRQLTDEVNEIINENAPKQLAEIVEDIIGQDDKTDMQQGVEYYQNENDIKDRTKYYYVDGEKKEDETKPNNKLPHNWHKLLVDQKVNYLFGNPPQFSDKEATEDESPNEDFINAINDILGERFSDDVWQLAKGCTNKGIEWLHPYINSDGEFSYKVIDARQCIPIWESSEQKELQAFIRYYLVQVDDYYRIKAEFWDKKKVKFYIENSGDNSEIHSINNMVPDTITEEEPEASHFYYGEGENRIGYGWEEVPFIPFKNNDEMNSDLQQYKELIDAYDLLTSDWVNDLEEMQEIIWNLQGYNGQDLKEFQENLRYYKAINTDAEGGVEAITLDIPVEAKEKILERLEEDIPMMAQAVNPKTDEFGSNASGVALKFLYSLLDLKADKTERKFQRAFRKLFWFIAEYLNISEGANYDPRVVKVTFDRSMIANEKEKVEMANQSKGVVSNRTIAENHPWVDDVEEELERQEQEQPGQDTFSQRLEQELNQVGGEGE